MGLEGARAVHPEGHQEERYQRCGQQHGPEHDGGAVLGAAEPLQACHSSFGGSLTWQICRLA